MEWRTRKDVLIRRLTAVLAVLCAALVVGMAVGLYLKARPVLAAAPLLPTIFSSDWSPQRGRFGLLPFLAGTVYVTLLAMVMAVPVSLFTAIYLSEYAPRRVRAAVLPLVDLLSGIPSVIYGVCGVLVVVPAVGRLARCFGSFSSGYSLLAGAVVLAVMVCPFIINVAREVLVSVPAGLREASLALGASPWQTTRRVVLRAARPGVIAAVMLGLSRAVGETIAVLMVVGNVPAVPRSLFDPAYPLPALLANNYGEMMSVPLYDSALMLSGLVLLAVVLVFNLAARAVLALARG